jgi:4-diphosphocytidyl-2-C-methyl-D-erythritol kinase
MSSVRRARVRALAKLNLALRVLGPRPDGYHELRTIYQTISLADALELEYRPGGPASVHLDCVPPIPDNLAFRAAAALVRVGAVRGTVRIRLTKRIPQGAGLGGGSSDAAAVLLALPVLAGASLTAAELLSLAEQLGSDVPFFLLGGTALGVGRGEEVYPLPDYRPRFCLVVVPELVISTREAYQALRVKLTPAQARFNISSFQSVAWAAAVGAPSGRRDLALGNDFEAVVFDKFPQLRSLKRNLQRLGAAQALLTGSGSAVYGLFDNREKLFDACARLAGPRRVFAARLVSRAQYWGLWRRWLAPHLDGTKAWPPRSRYAQ